jgi:hypothetical protein
MNFNKFIDDIILHIIKTLFDKFIFFHISLYLFIGR